MADQNRETSRGKRGTKIITDAARDDSSLNIKNPYGKDLGGSPTSLAHSVDGCSVAAEK